MEFYHVKLGNWQVLKVPQIDIAHQNLMPSLSNIILVQKIFSYNFLQED